MAKAHGGEVKATARPDGGLDVTVSLPAAPPANPCPPTPASIKVAEVVP